jgi:hypothetical protein
MQEDPVSQGAVVAFAHTFFLTYSCCTKQGNSVLLMVTIGSFMTLRHIGVFLASYQYPAFRVL